jgi:tetratricopeptide (TPR) repeat protein
LTACLWILPVCARASEESVRPGADAEAERLRSKWPSVGLDFESYQRNIDEIFRIAFMSRPSGEGGINGLIVDLNRKLEARPQDPETLAALGHVYRILGQPAEANRFYEKALLLEPSNARLNIFSAMSHAGENEISEAVKRLTRAISTNASDPYAWLARGQMLMMLRRDDEAAENFTRLLQIEPGNRQAIFALSVVYQFMGKFEEARALLEWMKERNPEDRFVRYHLGALNFTAGQPEAALEDWESLFKDGVRDIQFLTHLAIAYVEAGQGEKAEIILEHLNFFFPREIDIEFLLAESYRQMNRYQEAERRYRRVLAENPRYLSAYVGLVHVLEIEGKAAERAEVMKMAQLYSQPLNRLSEAEPEGRDQNRP